MESPETLNNDLNLFNTEFTSVLELADAIWNKVNSDWHFEYDAHE